jgi:hypothetical protein
MKLCLAKIPSWDKMRLTPELGGRFGRGFQLGRGRPVAAERKISKARPALCRRRTYASHRLPIRSVRRRQRLADPHNQPQQQHERNRENQRQCRCQ